MSGTTIQDRFLQFYPRLRERLARRLGSRDAADDALNEAFLKLARVADGAAIRDSQAFLFRIAMNTATDQRRAGARLASAVEIEAAMSIADPLADPLRTLEGHLAIERLVAAIGTLTPRRRAVLEAVRMQGKSCQQVAKDLDLSRRTIELELRAALEHCAQHLGKAGFDFANRHDETSD